MGVAARWTRFCRRGRWGIVAFWLAASACGLVWGPKLLSATISQYQGPLGT
jgi:uncharacterized membrane protein YdfJ with MMPL/SSD domain